MPYICTCLIPRHCTHSILVKVGSGTLPGTRSSQRERGPGVTFQQETSPEGESEGGVTPSTERIEVI